MLNPTQPLFFMLAYLAVLYVRPHEYVPALMGLPILPLMLVSSVLLWAARQEKNLSAPQFKLLPVQAFLMAWSVLLSGWAGGAIKVITDFVPVVLLFYMLATSVDTVAKFRKVFFVLGCGMIIIALHSIHQAQEVQEGIGWTGAKMVNGRVTYLGFLNDPNDLSMALLMILPMQLYLMRKSGWIMKLFWANAAFLTLWAVKLCNSRGAILALAAMMMMNGILRFGLMRTLLAAPIMVVPLIIFGPSRMNEISDDEESAEGRIDSWFEGFHMLAGHPLFGVGKGLFTEYHHLTAHNSYVLAVSELGLVGYFVWFASIALCWKMLWSLQTVGPPPVQETVVAAPPRKLPFGAKIPVASQADKALAAGPAVDGWADIHECARTLWYGYVAALVAMFFLSRSYVTILYVHLALIVAVYQAARVLRPDVPLIAWADSWPRIMGLAFASVFGLWVVTMVLLRI